MHWYTPARVQGSLPEVIASLAEVRVKFQLSSIQPVYVPTDDHGHLLVMKEIGMIKVFDDGAIAAIAYEGLCGDEIRVLLGSAEVAITAVPRARDGWNRRRNNGRPRWEHIVQLPVDEADDTVARIAARDVDRYARELEAARLDAAFEAQIKATT